MYLFIELWQAKQAWLALSKQERAAYVKPMNPSANGLRSKGIEIVGWSFKEPKANVATEYVCMTAYRTPTLELAQLVEQKVRGPKWYDYFERTYLLSNQREGDSLLAKEMGFELK